MKGYCAPSMDLGGLQRVLQTLVNIALSLSSRMKSFQYVFVICPEGRKREVGLGIREV